MEQKPIVAMQSVGFRYSPEREILKDIDLAIRPGEFYFLTGTSGAGKTTFLNLVNLTLRPTRGMARVFGHSTEDSTADERAGIRRRIGVVFQEYRLLNHLSVLENVSLPLRVTGKGDKYIRTHVPELVEWVGLKRQMHRSPAELSGGEQQRAAIARAVINNPEILIADEPTGNVDDEMASKLLFLFLELNKMGTTVIIATHSKNLIRQLHFPVLRLVDGKMIREDPYA
ncbi:MAG: ATP-binding cassette domain-containing protein [Rickettsiales bacterium]|jgi:cell division transport system ATP-binding protein|nr:ATP-binding cassette domain-containing protein [Rickettsiales bacterium]